MMKSFLLVLLTASPAAAFVASPAGTEAIIAAPQSLASSTALSATSDPTSRRGMLATSLATLATLAPVVLPASAIETYLTEPTDEFKESERQRMEFRKKQLAQKGEFVKVLARLTSESSTEDELVTDLKELRALVVQTEGLPLGIKKEDFYKVIRSKKAKGFWPTNVEIA